MGCKTHYHANNNSDTDDWLLNVQVQMCKLVGTMKEWAWPKK